MYLVSLHGHGTSAWPGASGAPTECRPGRTNPSRSIARSAGVPIRVMIRIETTTYGESVISTPSWAIAAAERAHAERDHVHGAAAHAAVEELREGLAHLVRVDPVVGRAGVLLVLASR